MIDWGSGKTWMILWIIVGAVSVAWGIGTVIWWLDSTRNLNLMSVFTAIIATMAGFQATLSMRKADRKDDL